VIKKLSLILFLLWLIPITLIYFHKTDVFDQDLGRHLKIGEIIVKTHEVPKINLFSYTNPQEPVFNSHWGSQVIFYGIYQLLGINGLILLSVLVNTTAFGLLFYLVTRRMSIVVPSVLLIPYLFLLLDRSWVRPEMFGNLFFAIVLYALFDTKWRRKIKWAFPFITLLWINTHITAVIGVGAMGVVLGQEILDGGIRGKRWIRGMRGSGIILIGILGALLLNPYGLQGAFTAFTVLNKYGYSIVENQSWLFLRDYGFPVVGYLAVGLFVVFTSYFLLLSTRRKPMFGEVLLLIVLTIAAFRFVRNDVLFAYIAFVSCCFNFAAFRPAEKQGMKDIGISLACILLSIFIIISQQRSRGLPIGLGSQESYRAGVDYFLANNKGPIFNNFDIGGYLIYRMHDREPVFVDNRPEAYPVDFFQKTYISMQIDQKIFDEGVKTYNIKTVIWGTHDITPWSRDFMNRMVVDKAWNQVYKDDAMVIYTKK
jgi:hypothetical protein